MVVASLTLGGVVGVLLSGAFLWTEVGRFAVPQVAETRFDERKLLAGYTVGLFAGVPLAVAYVLYAVSASNGALFGAALFLGLLVAGSEVGQRLVARTQYWVGPATPFYVVAFRCGIGGILALAVVAAYLGAVVTPTILGTASAVLTAGALVALQVAGALLSTRDVRPEAARVGGPLAGALFGVIALLVLGLGISAGAVGAVAAPLIVLAGAAVAYRGRRPILSAVPPPSAVGRPPIDRPLPFGRTESPPPGDGGPTGPGP